MSVLFYLKVFAVCTFSLGLSSLCRFGLLFVLCLLFDVARFVGLFDCFSFACWLLFIYGLSCDTAVFVALF